MHGFGFLPFSSGWSATERFSGKDDFGESSPVASLWPMRHTARRNAGRVKKQLIGKQR
jgi:hypothetical protein